MSERVVIVTGAAGAGAGGSGKAIAKKFAQNGDTVIIIDINKEAGAITEKEFIDAGYKAKFIATDLCEEEQIKNAIETTVSEYGKIDVLVNCAFAIINDRCVADMDAATFDKMLGINLRGHFLMTKYALPHIMKQEGGNIVNVSSIGGCVGEANGCAYGAAKAGLTNLTYNTAAQYGRKGVRCNVVLPGLILTKAMEDMSDDASKAYFGLLDKQTLLTRHGNCDDIANAVYFLASDEASFITAATLNVDGGILAHNPTWGDITAFANM